MSPATEANLAVPPVALGQVRADRHGGQIHIADRQEPRYICHYPQLPTDVVTHLSARTIEQLYPIVVNGPR